MIGAEHTTLSAPSIDYEDCFIILQNGTFADGKSTPAYQIAKLGCDGAYHCDSHPMVLSKAQEELSKRRTNPTETRPEAGTYMIRRPIYERIPGPVVGYWYWDNDAATWHEKKELGTIFTKEQRETYIGLRDGGEWVLLGRQQMIKLSELRNASSQIKALGHDPATNTLIVEFQSGHVYHYENVDEAGFQALRDAPSAGKHLHQHIRTNPEKHPYQKIGGGK